MVEATRAYVCVRIENMKDVDLSIFTFDYGLTFCALLMHADGTILHTYGGRVSSSAQSHLSVSSLIAALQAGVASHGAHVEHARLQGTGTTIQQLPPMAKRIAAGKAPDCFHCHMVDDMRLEERKERGVFKQEDTFLWPDPIQVGWTLERDDPTRLAAVVSGSVAHKAGMRVGDQLRGIGQQAVATFGDVQRALQDADAGAGRLIVRYEREAKESSATLRLSRDWKRPDPAHFAWRPTKWLLDPRPGFGGPELTEAEKKALGIPEADFAFRVNYLVTWGDEARTGQNAARAGLKKGDVVLSVGGKRDFESIDHFHAWVRLAKEPGEALPLEVLRGKERLSLPLRLLPAR